MAEGDDYDIRQIAQRRHLRRAYQGRASVDQLLELTNNEPRHTQKKASSAGDFSSNRTINFPSNSIRRDSEFDNFPLHHFKRNETNGVSTPKQNGFIDNLPGLINDQNMSSANGGRKGTSNARHPLPFLEGNRMGIDALMDKQPELSINSTVLDARRPSLSNSLISSLPFDDGGRVGRTQVPPAFSCECNGIEAKALIDTSSNISLMSSSFADKARLNDDIIREISSMRNPFMPEGMAILGRLKYLEIYISDSLYITQLYVVDRLIADITFGTDFLRKSLAVIDFDNNHVIFGGKQKKQKVAFLSNKQVLLMSNANRFQ